MNLSNPADKDFLNNYVTITFPADDDELANNLRALGIEDSIDLNCNVNSCTAEISMLNILEGCRVNADEVNYLARRLESFDKYEKDKFQAVVYLKDMTDVKDMINLTFNLNNYTLIQEFKDISAIGLQNYLDKNFCIGEDEKPQYDFHALGMDLIMSNKGEVTPIGVIFENGMEMEQIYDGRVFPQYEYKADWLISAYLTRKDDITETPDTVWFYFPEPDSCLNKGLMRLGVQSLSECSLYIEDMYKLPTPLREVVMSDFNYDSLNFLSRLVNNFSDFEISKLNSVADYAHAFDSHHLVRLAENLDQFRFAPKVRNYEDCGRCLIMDSGGFKPEESPEEFDYKGYVEDLIFNKNGRFVKGGFVCAEANIYEIIYPNQVQEQQEGCGEMNMEL